MRWFGSRRLWAFGDDGQRLRSRVDAAKQRRQAGSDAANIYSKRTPPVRPTCKEAGGGGVGNGGMRLKASGRRQRDQFSSRSRGSSGDGVVEPTRGYFHCRCKRTRACAAVGRGVGVYGDGRRMRVPVQYCKATRDCLKGENGPRIDSYDASTGVL